MNCDEADVLLHALMDGELDAGHAHEVETHIARCQECAARLRDFEDLRKRMRSPDLRYVAPDALRARIEGAMPAAPRKPTPTRRSLLRGFGAGAGLTALAASGVFMVVMRADDQQNLLGDIVSAHLRSLQGDRLIDVVSTDQHTVKPWFNGRLPVAPPVVDLTAQGFVLAGGRLDYLDGNPVAVIVYRRRAHVINLFCSPAPGAAPRRPTMQSLKGYNVRSWTENGLSLWAVSDINQDELNEFGQKFDAALQV